MDCNIGLLVEAREQINAAAPKDKEGKPAYKLSVNDFVLKALALALQRIPDANVSWTEGGMLKHKHSDVGVAVAIPHGLITPIIRHAESKSLSTISNEMKDFAARARTRKLKPNEYQGGTTAVSNLGMYGIKDFTAVINPPHATILAAGATTDLLARLIAMRLSETMGQSFVVENVGGGGGSIGADQVAKAAPDGHALLFHNITFSTTTSSLLFAKRARHDFDDFVPVSVGAYVPLLLLANNSVPANDLKEFVAYAKST